MIVIKYIIFAAIAIITNVSTQYMIFSIYKGPFSFYVALCVGTLAGLLIKYVLDKKYIFYFHVRTSWDDSKRFLLYSLMGTLTTFVFWSFEIGFDLLFETNFAKYIGAVIGLCIGYFLKYKLDAKFVFRRLEEWV